MNVSTYTPSLQATRLLEILGNAAPAMCTLPIERPAVRVSAVALASARATPLFAPSRMPRPLLPLEPQRDNAGVASQWWNSAFGSKDPEMQSGATGVMPLGTSDWMDMLATPPALDAIACARQLVREERYTRRSRVPEVAVKPKIVSFWNEATFADDLASKPLSLIVARKLRAASNYKATLKSTPFHADAACEIATESMSSEQLPPVRWDVSKQLSLAELDMLTQSQMRKLGSALACQSKRTYAAARIVVFAALCRNIHEAPQPSAVSGCKDAEWCSADDLLLRQTVAQTQASHASLHQKVSVPRDIDAENKHMWAAIANIVGKPAAACRKRMRLISRIDALASI